MPSYHSQAKINPSKRSYTSVKRAVEDVYKSPTYRSAIVVMGGVQAVTTTIFGVINSAAQMFKPLGAILNSILAVYSAIGFARSKVEGALKEILAQLT